MKLLDKYLCKEFLKFFGLFQLSFLTIYLIIDFIQKIDNFVEANASKEAMFAYFYFKIPFITVQLVPVATLLSVIVMFCIMKSNNEITASKACGVSVYELARPLVLMCVGISIVVFLFSELVVPYTSSKSTGIWNSEVKKRDRQRLYGKLHIWYRGSNAIYWIKHFDPENSVMENVAFYFFNDEFQLIRRIDAKRGKWTGDKWRIEEGLIQTAQLDGVYKLEDFDQMDLELPERPEAFNRTIRLPEEMSYWELKRYAETIRFEGYDATRYLVDMNIKLAFPAINFVVVLIGIPLALGTKRGGTALAVSLGIAVCFLYLVTYGLARSFGLSGILPPVLSAWLANAVFFFIGAYLMVNVET